MFIHSSFQKSESQTEREVFHPEVFAQ